MSTPNRNDPCPCGSGKKYKKCCLIGADAPAPAASAARHNVNSTNAAAPSALLMQAVTLHQAGRLDEAEAAYRRLLTANPDDYDALHYLGLVALQKGRAQEAVDLIERAIRIHPAVPAFHCNLGNAYRRLGKPDSAIAALAQAVQLDPHLHAAYSNMGNVLLEQGKRNEAAACFRKAISILPDFAEAHYNLGNTLRLQGKLDEAVSCYRAAINFKPGYTEALHNLGNELHKLGKLDEALACYRQVQALQPNNALRVACALMLPPIMGTKAEVLESRIRFEHNLDSLIAENIQLSDSHEKYGTTNFLLAYHGLNDRDIQQKIARFYEQACPALLYTAPHCTEKRAKNSRLRIGFLSSFIYAHSVSACFNKIVSGLANREEFEILLISTHDHNEESARNTYPDFSGSHVRLPDNLARARETVAALKLDVLVYLDIGMEPLSYFLAFSRLAREQCVIGGHPVTTGIRNLDYFLSSALSEPENAEEHYSEKLIRLPIRPSYFGRPALPAVYKTRKELGLPENGHIYSCPMRLQKLHPDFDEAITRILQLDTSGHIILFGDRVCTSWQGLLEERLRRTIPAQILGRVIFRPWIINFADFASMNHVSDVVLDPFHFGIGTTAIATFSVGTPIITKPGEFLRGRIGFQFCKLLDIPECVATDTEDYARKAVNIASDTSLRNSIKARIQSNDHLLFDNPQTISDMANFFLTLEPQLNTVNSI